MYKKVFLYRYTLYMIGLLCSSRKNPYPPHGRSLEIPRGEGVLKVKILEAKYEAKLEFPGGEGGCKTKNLLLGGVWIFPGTAHSYFSLEDNVQGKGDGV